MRLIFNYIFILLLCLGSAVYLLQNLGYELPHFIQNHFNDLLIIPIVLWIALITLRALLPSQNIGIPLWAIILIVMGYSIYFEYYLPSIHPRYTGDFWDVCCYALGGWFFYFWQHYTLK